MQPTYYVRHPDDTYSAAEPQPAESLANAAISALSQLGRMVGNSEHENNRIHAALAAAFSECAPLATPADAGAGLTDERAYELVAEHEIERNLFGNAVFDAVGVLKLVRAIEREVLARLSTSGAPVTAEHMCATCKDTGIVYTGPIGDPPEQCEACFDQEHAGSPAPVTAEPAQSIDTPEFRELMVNFGYWVDEEEAEHDECAADLIAYIDKRLAPAPADRDAILEQAVSEVESVTINSDAEEWAVARAVAAIRKLKSMERAADAKGDAA